MTQFMRYSSLALLLLILLPATLAVKATELPISEQTQQQLDSYFKALAEDNRFLGTAAIYQGNKPLYQVTVKAQSNGQLSNEHGRKYKIGSISKTFTSAIILKLIEEGKLSLDSKLAEFYPQIANAEDITIEQMLSHHSGIFNYTSDDGFIHYVYKPQDKAAMLKRLAAFEPAFAPGEKAEYSNSNYLLLGYIAEDITQKTYPQLVQDMIAKPLQLKDTYFGADITPANNEVFSYQFTGSWRKVPEWDMSSAGAAGAVVSNANDLNRFITALFGGQIISKQSLATMTEMRDNFGLGIFATEYQQAEQRLKGYWHNGGIEGFRSHLAYYPQQDLTVVVLANGLRYDMPAIYRTLLDAYHQQPITAPDLPKPVTLSRAQLEPLVGDYSSETFPLDIKVMLKGDQLYAQATGQGPFPLTAYSEKRFEYIEAGIEMTFDAANGQFVIKQGGTVNIFTKQGAKPVAKVSVPLATLEQYVGVYKSKDFPLDLEVMLKDGNLFAQATGQPAFPLTADSATRFRFDLAGIVINFDAKKKRLTITQHGKDTVLSKD